MSEAENIENTESTATPVDATETQEKLFTQQDLDKIVADRVSRERRKYDKKYEGVDIDTYQDLMAKAEQEREEKLKAKGEFEKLLKEQADKKDAQISQLMKTVETIKVDDIRNLKSKIMGSHANRRAEFYMKKIKFVRHDIEKKLLINKKKLSTHLNNNLKKYDLFMNKFYFNKGNTLLIEKLIDKEIKKFI